MNRSTTCSFSSTKFAGHVQPGSAVEVADVDDQRVAFPAAARVAVPRPVVLRMRAVVGGNDADVVHRFVQQRHVLLVLDDLHRIEPAGLIERARNPGQMATRLGILVAASAGGRPSLGFGLRRVLVLRRRRATARAPSVAAASAPAGGEIRPVERSDEQALKAAGALHPEALQDRDVRREVWATRTELPADRIRAVTTARRARPSETGRRGAVRGRSWRP